MIGKRWPSHSFLHGLLKSENRRSLYDQVRFIFNDENQDKNSSPKELSFST